MSALIRLAVPTDTGPAAARVYYTFCPVPASFRSAC